jgi:hypothetical protein
VMTVKFFCAHPIRECQWKIMNLKEKEMFFPI